MEYFVHGKTITEFYNSALENLTKACGETFNLEVLLHKSRVSSLDQGKTVVASHQSVDRFCVKETFEQTTRAYGFFYCFNDFVVKSEDFFITISISFDETLEKISEKIKTAFNNFMELIRKEEKDFFLSNVIHPSLV